MSRDDLAFWKRHIALRTDGDNQVFTVHELATRGIRRWPRHLRKARVRQTEPACIRWNKIITSAPLREWSEGTYEQSLWEGPGNLSSFARQQGNPE